MFDHLKLFKLDENFIAKPELEKKVITLLCQFKLLSFFFKYCQHIHVIINNIFNNSLQLDSSAFDNFGYISGCNN